MPPTVSFRPGGWRRSTRCGSSARNSRSRATRPATWRPSSPPGWSPRRSELIAENLHRNFIDHAEYPITAEIEQRCIRMLADLFHAPGETTGARTQGSSEAIMLGALSLKWKWRERREAEGKPTDQPNLVFGGDVHVVWEKFCRYFDVEPRIVPLQEGKYTIGPEDVEPHLDENTIGVAAVLGTTFTGHTDDIVGINELLVRLKDEKGLDIPMHVDAASGGFVWPFLYPDSKWDFRLEQVRSINVSGHKFGLVYPGDRLADLPREGRPAPRTWSSTRTTSARPTPRSPSTSRPASAMVLAQYYNFVRLGREGYTYVMQAYAAERPAPGRAAATAAGDFEVIGADEEQLPLVAFRLVGEQALRRVRRRLAALRRARLDGAGVHAAAERRGREDHAGAGQGDDEPGAGRPPGRPTSRTPARRSTRRAAPTSRSAARSRPAPGTDRSHSVEGAAVRRYRLRGGSAAAAAGGDRVALVGLEDVGYGTGWVIAAIALFLLVVALGSLGGRRPKHARPS